MDYLQVLEEAKKHKKEKFLPSITATTSRYIKSLHFKLQKTISKEESSKKKKHKSKWWKNALLFSKKKWVYQNDQVNSNYRGTILGPVYITESRSGSSTPCQHQVHYQTRWRKTRWTKDVNKSKLLAKTR
ncbi:hypothetical protein MKX01_039920 [Papaver californicum]|nr:hypothetical protein MKX01_039920 [Papaver californicum]